MANTGRQVLVYDCQCDSVIDDLLTTVISVQRRDNCMSHTMQLNTISTHCHVY